MNYKLKTKLKQRVQQSSMHTDPAECDKYCYYTKLNCVSIKDVVSMTQELCNGIIVLEAAAMLLDVNAQFGIIDSTHEAKSRRTHCPPLTNTKSSQIRFNIFFLFNKIFKITCLTQTKNLKVYRQKIIGKKSRLQPIND